MGRSKVITNFNRALQQVEASRISLRGRTKLVIHIFNRAKHFVYIEFGTSKIEAFAMVRQSLPLIKRLLDSELSKLPLFFTQEQLDVMCDYVAREAVIEIVRRTPRDTGELQAKMRAEVVKE